MNPMPLSWRLLQDQMMELDWIRTVAGWSSPAALQWWIARVADYSEIEA
jgi:hypothetical protein